MAAKTFTKKEAANRQALSISRFRKVVKPRAGEDPWLFYNELRFDVRYGYECTDAQAKALIEIGIMNGYIEYDKDREKYRLTEA
ncbi:MAG: hypothetical protein HUU01_14120 [Saprospiraceae bacterium]|nr:hypothetical protein [Saprospiraceae bacterium]